MSLQLEKLHFNPPPTAKKSPNGGKQLYKIQLPGQETAFIAKRVGYFPSEQTFGGMTAGTGGLFRFYSNIANIKRLEHRQH